MCGLAHQFALWSTGKSGGDFVAEKLNLQVMFDGFRQRICIPREGFNARPVR